MAHFSAQSPSLFRIPHTSHEHDPKSVDALLRSSAMIDHPNVITHNSVTLSCDSSEGALQESGTPHEYNEEARKLSVGKHGMVLLTRQC